MSGPNTLTESTHKGRGAEGGKEARDRDYPLTDQREKVGTASRTVIIRHSGHSTGKYVGQIPSPLANVGYLLDICHGELS